MTNKREILQLWYGAKLYFDLAVKIVLDPDIMKKKVIESSNEYLENNCLSPLFIFSAHLSSSAIRLYSIDEKLQSADRFLFYKDSWQNKQKGAKNFNPKNTNKIIHCVLRNMIAHEEEIGKAKSIKSNRSYNELINYYNNLTHNDILIGMKEVVDSIKKDIENYF